MAEVKEKIEILGTHSKNTPLTILQLILEHLSAKDILDLPKDKAEPQIQTFMVSKSFRKVIEKSPILQLKLLEKAISSLEDAYNKKALEMRPIDFKVMMSFLKSIRIRALVRKGKFTVQEIIKKIQAHNFGTIQTSDISANYSYYDYPFNNRNKAIELGVLPEEIGDQFDGTHLEFLKNAIEESKAKVKKSIELDQLEKKQANDTQQDNNLQNNDNLKLQEEDAISDIINKTTVDIKMLSVDQIKIMVLHGVSAQSVVKISNIEPNKIRFLVNKKYKFEDIVDLPERLCEAIAIGFPLDVAKKLKNEIEKVSMFSLIELYQAAQKEAASELSEKTNKTAYDIAVKKSIERQIQDYQGINDLNQITLIKLGIERSEVQGFFANLAQLKYLTNLKEQGKDKKYIQEAFKITKKMEPNYFELLDKGFELDAIKNLNHDQVYAVLKLGCSLEKVKSIHKLPGNSYLWENLTSKGFSIEQIFSYTTNQLYGLQAGISHDEVNIPNYSNLHTSLLKKGFDISQIKHLNVIQLAAIEEHDLSIEEVDHDWFEYAHLDALAIGRTYQEICGLTILQAQALIAKRSLKREHVMAPWFKEEHLSAIKAGFSYDEINGLSVDAVTHLRLTSQPKQIQKPVNTEKKSEQEFNGTENGAKKVAQNLNENAIANVHGSKNETANGVEKEIIFTILNKDLPNQQHQPSTLASTTGTRLI